VSLDGRMAGEGSAARARRAVGDLDASDFVCVLVILMLLIPSDQIIPGLGVSPGNFIASLLAFLWLCLHAGRGLPIAKGATPVRTGVFALVGATALSFVAGMYGYLNAGEVKNSTHTVVLFVATIGACLFIVDAVRSYRGVAQIARVFTLATTAVAVAGIVETLVGSNFVSELRIPGLQPTSFADLTQASRDALVRAQSTAGHPIEFGVLCGMVLPFAVHFAVHEPRFYLRSVYWMGAAALAAGAVFSISRSAIIALVAVGVVVLIGASARERYRGTAVVVLSLGILWVVAPRVVGALTSFFLNASSDPSVGARTDDYSAVAEEFARSPVLGRGPGTWYAPVHRIFDNQYLLTIVEDGALGLVCRLGILIVSLWCLIRLQARDPYRGQSLPLACAASLAVVVLTSATFDFTSFSTVNTLSLVIIGMTGSLYRGEFHEKVSSELRFSGASSVG
jgi:hypothetical protein